ncbi:MAG: cupredoxin domain-containing protein [Candidatus Pacebacteria bacterium]|nr:cupredoxin domain-containing protein [Candidatus Paceibacterota bacterium]
MKTNTIAILIVVVLIGASFVYSQNKNKDVLLEDTEKQEIKEVKSNVSVVDGKQIITIDARGGYFPQVTIAKADMPTIIKMATKSTFDCSSALVIPDLNYQKNLPPTAVTEIEVPPQKAGEEIQGLCSMGMYSVIIEFRN